MSKIICGCGGGLGVHELGTSECFRKIATGNLIPCCFGQMNGVDICEVNGHTITVHDLKNQRLYHYHENGIWSLPKDESSTPSIQMTD